jgi:two-component system heavy metal sensor histidine kinase CusS
MSWKTGPKPPRHTLSLATSLTLWYALSAFALVFVATGYLYFALSRNYDREDDQFLTSRVRAVELAIESGGLDKLALGRAIGTEDAGVESGQIMIRVIDALGAVVAESPGMSHALPIDKLPPMTKSSSPESRTEYESESKRSYRLLVVNNWSGGYSIQAAMDRTHDAELLEEYRRHLSYILGISLIICAVGGYFIARHGMRPVEEVAKMAERIHSTNLDQRLELAGKPAEISNLAETFNNMLDRLKDSFARMAQFSADIAHELRTPVNNLRGEIEVALGKARSPSEYQEVLASGLEECQRLSRMIDSLLFLARAEQPKSVLNREQIDVGEELERVREFFEPSASEKQVTLNLTAPKGLIASLDRTLIHRAIGNLVENALAHTPPGGHVTLEATGLNDEFVIAVADTGSGISQEHLPYLFDRFYRADRSRTKGAGGFGLGLAIVKGITEIHGGKIEIASRNGEGTKVTMRFPRGG